MSLGLDHTSISPPPVAFPVRRLTVEEYHQLADTGVFKEDDRVELLEGIVSPKMVHKPPHDASVELADEAVSKILPADWKVRIQSAITTEDSEPEPDLAVVRGSARERVTKHPGPKDIGLLIEVAESSLARDREKCRIYARAGIEVYWIINLVDACVEVYSQPLASPAEPCYAQSAKYIAGEGIPLALDGADLPRVAVVDVLP